MAGRLGSATSFLTTFFTTFRTTGASTGGELPTKSSPRLGGAALPLEEMTRLGAPVVGGAPALLSCSVAEPGAAVVSAAEALVGALPLSAARWVGLPSAVASGPEAPASDSTAPAAARSPAAGGSLVSGASVVATVSAAAPSSGTPSDPPSAPGSAAGSWRLAAFRAAAFWAAAFLAVFGSCSGGCSSRIKPSRCALRRTRSACASTMLEEWLFTPIPNASVNSRVSLLVSPSSRASSYTRIFDGTFWRKSLR